MMPSWKDKLVIAGRTAVVVGTIALLSTLGVRVSEAINFYRWAYPETPLEQQATDFLTRGIAPTAPPSDVEAWIQRREEAIEVRAERLAACENIINKHASVHGKTVTSIPSNAMSYFIAAPCHFYDPSARPNIRDIVVSEVHVGQAIVQSLAIAALTAVVIFTALAVLAYPHLGWRRIAASAAPLLGISVGVTQWLTTWQEGGVHVVVFGVAMQEALLQAIAVAIFGTVLIGPAILGSRELYLWVARGFAAENEPPKA